MYYLLEVQARDPISVEGLAIWPVTAETERGEVLENQEETISLKTIRKISSTKMKRNLRESVSSVTRKGT